jgi:hypothetical protein
MMVILTYGRFGGKTSFFLTSWTPALFLVADYIFNDIVIEYKDWFKILFIPASYSFWVTLLVIFFDVIVTYVGDAAASIEVASALVASGYVLIVIFFLSHLFNYLLYSYISKYKVD